MCVWGSYYFISFHSITCRKRLPVDGDNDSIFFGLAHFFLVIELIVTGAEFV
jgi:hypothetical protein